jgi:hypothetical protein
MTEQTKHIQKRRGEANMQHGFKYACRVLVGGHLVAEVLEVLFREHRAAREEELASL